MRHLDEAVGGMALGEVCDGEGLGVRELFDLHGEEGDSVFLLAEGVGLVLLGIVCRVVEAGEVVRRGDEVEYEAEGDASGEEVPELRHWVGRLARVGRAEVEVGGEAPDAHEAASEGRALLVEGC